LSKTENTNSPAGAIRLEAERSNRYEPPVWRPINFNFQILVFAFVGIDYAITDDGLR